MPLQHRDRVAETTTTTGTGTVNLSGSAPVGYRTFASAHDTGATVRYSITNAGNTEWEVGEGIFTDSSPDTLSRVTVYASSNAGALVNFSAGTKSVIEVMTAASVPRVPVTPDTYPAAPNAADDEFDEGSSIDTAGTRRAGATAWSWVNQGTATANLSGGHLVLTAPASGAVSIRAAVQAVSGAAWKYRAKLAAVSGAKVDFFAAGMIVRNSSSAKSLTLQKGGGTTRTNLGVERNTNDTTYSATVLGDDIFGPQGYIRSFRHPMYLEIELTGGNLVFRYSDSGAEGTFIYYTQEATATHIISVDQIGLFANALNSQPAWGVWDWFRRVA